MTDNLRQLYVQYDSHTWCTRERDESDEWDAGDYDGEYYVTGVTLAPKGYSDYFYTSEDVNIGDVVHVVYADYRSGSTFGTSGGYGQIICVTKDSALAAEVEAWCHKQTTWDYKGYGPDKPAILGEHFYCAWIGYFESLRALRNDTFVVQ